jgi:autotransporter-associated beta strand protein
MGDTSGTTGHSQLTLNNSSWIKVNGEVWLGQNTLSADHVINVNGTSTITSESWFCVGRGTGTGVLNVNGGTVKKEGTNSDGSPNGNFILGSDRGNGTVYLESGSILNNAQVILGENSGAVANFHLDGGLVQATALAINGTGVYASNMYYNGGTLQATADSTNFVNAGVMQYVQAKGAVIDSNTHAITINTAFTEDYLTPSPGGGLTKIGAGTLTLGGWNSYTGYTTVTNGILQAAITGSLPNYGIAGNVKVSTGATIAVNAGGVSDWLASEVNTLDTNAAYSGGSYIGFDTTNATPSFTYSYAVANPLSGTKGLKKLGTNTLVLDATNTYSGNTVINNGTLELASTGQIATASAISTAATTAIFQVDGTHTVGNISGVGTTNLLAGSSLTATSVVQGTVTLGIGARLTIAPIPGGPTAGAGSLSAVPEPSTWAMLMLAAMGLGMYWRRSR